ATIMKVMRDYEKALRALEKDPASESAQAFLLKMQQQMDEQDAWEANTAAKTDLTRLGITDFDKNVTALSGGQKKRVAIAKALIQPGNLLIIEESTNHPDNETVEWLEKLLASYKRALLLDTHPRYFVNRATNCMYKHDKGKLNRYEGKYEVFLEKQ